MGCLMRPICASRGVMMSKGLQTIHFSGRTPVPSFGGKFSTVQATEEKGYDGPPQQNVPAEVIGFDESPTVLHVTLLENFGSLKKGDQVVAEIKANRTSSPKLVPQLRRESHLRLGSVVELSNARAFEDRVTVHRFDPMLTNRSSQAIVLTKQPFSVRPKESPHSKFGRSVWIAMPDVAVDVDCIETAAVEMEKELLSEVGYGRPGFVFKGSDNLGERKRHFIFRPGQTSSDPRAVEGALRDFLRTIPTSYYDTIEDTGDWKIIPIIAVPVKNHPLIESRMMALEQNVPFGPWFETARFAHGNLVLVSDQYENWSVSFAKTFISNPKMVVTMPMADCDQPFLEPGTQNLSALFKSVDRKISESAMV
jgi:hypothetical protein